MIVDGIQAVGATVVDASQAGAYVASVFKWLLAGFGLAIVVTRPEFRNSLTPAFRGYFNPPPSRELRYGHISYPVLCALEASLSYMDGLGWQATFEQTASLRDLLMERLAQAGIGFATPRDAAAGIVAIRADNAEALSAALRQRNVFVEARGPLLRASPHFYNTADEIERFVGHLQELRKDGIS
jgi:selenocysteine lyase/cysteine desulfurase